MGESPHVDGVLLLRDLKMPTTESTHVDVPVPGVTGVGDTLVRRVFLRQGKREGDF